MSSQNGMTACTCPCHDRGELCEQCCEGPAPAASETVAYDDATSRKLWLGPAERASRNDGNKPASPTFPNGEDEARHRMARAGVAPLLPRSQDGGDRSTRLLAALREIRTAGYNESDGAEWMQKVAAHAMEPERWPHPGPQEPRASRNGQCVELRAALDFLADAEKGVAFGPLGEHFPCDWAAALNKEREESHRVIRALMADLRAREADAENIDWLQSWKDATDLVGDPR